MADSWEDDWEAEAEQLIAGVNLHEVDESKFEGEADAPIEDDWENAVPSSQPKKVTESKYAAKDRAAAEAAANAAQIDQNDAAAVARAQAEAEMRMFAGDISGGGAASDGANELDAMQPKTNAEFETYATKLVELYGTTHKDSKQYRFFVKQVARALCDVLDTDGIKDVETALAGMRSDKLKAQRAAAAKEKKGNKKSIKMESNDITAGLDDLKFRNYGDADDDVDFM